MIDDDVTTSLRRKCLPKGESFSQRVDRIYDMRDEAGRQLSLERSRHSILNMDIRASLGNPRCRLNIVLVGPDGYCNSGCDGCDVLSEDEFMTYYLNLDDWAYCANCAHVMRVACTGRMCQIGAVGIDGAFHTDWEPSND